MNVLLEDLSKRFDENMVLKKINFHFKSGGRYGIKGGNGSGKSTLLKMISGHLTPSRGKIVYRLDEKAIDRSSIFKHLSFTAPYIDVIDDFNLKELYDYHSSFKKLDGVKSLEDFRAILDYDEIQAHKLIMNYSSGMKNRLKLAFHILTEADLLLLDEPSSFLDTNGVAWFQNLLEGQLKNKTVIIASNDSNDFKHCREILDISEMQG